MSDRLSAALRELAAALEEAEAAAREKEVDSGLRPKAEEPVGRNTGRGSSSSGVSSGASLRAPLTSDPSGSTVAYREDWRHYIIVSNPRDPSFVGWTAGPGALTWRSLESRLPGGKLSGSAVRLRRVNDKEGAERVWRAAHPGIKMPNLPL